jgi:hypothetical protein
MWGSRFNLSVIICVVTTSWHPSAPWPRSNVALIVHERQCVMHLSGRLPELHIWQSLKSLNQLLNFESADCALPVWQLPARQLLRGANDPPIKS